MRVVVREKLHHYIAEHGTKALEDLRSLRLYLLQEEGRFSQEIDGLLRIVEEDILPPFPGAEDREIYVQRIMAQIGVSREDALWFLESWEGVQNVLEPLNVIKGEEGESPLSEKEKSFAAQALSASLQEFLSSPRSFKPQPLSSSMESFLRGRNQQGQENALGKKSALPGEELPSSSKQDAEKDLPPLSQDENQNLQNIPSEGKDVSSLRPGEEFVSESVTVEHSLPSEEEIPVQEPELLESPDVRESENAYEEPPQTVPFREDFQKGNDLSEGMEKASFGDGTKENYLLELVHQEGTDPEYIGSRENSLLLDGAFQKKRSFRLAFMGLSGVVLALFVGGFMWYSSAANLLQRGRNALEKKAYPESISLFRKVLVKRPQDGEAHRLLGEALYFQGDYLGSLTAFRNASQLVSPDVFLHNDMGYTYLSLERSEEALHAFEKALALVPHYPQALKGLALAYLQKGENHCALIKMNEALVAIPEDGELLFALGTLNAMAGSFDRAESLFSRVLVLDPGNESARIELEKLRSHTQGQGSERSFAQHLDKGEGFLISGDAQAAARVYRNVLQNDTYSQEARTGLLDALLMLELSEDAASLVEETWEMAKAGTIPGDFAEYMEQNMASYEAKLVEKRARQQGYDMAIAKASQMRERGEFEGAFAAYQGILEEEEYLPAYIGLGRTLAKQGKYAQALEAYERAQALGRSFQGEGVAGVDEEIKALKVLSKKEARKKEIEAIYNRGLGFERKGKTKRAEELYREILARDPSYQLAAKGLRRVTQSKSTSSAKETPLPSSRGGNGKTVQKPTPELVKEAPPAWLVLPNGDSVVSEKK